MSDQPATKFGHLFGKHLGSGTYSWDAHRTMLYAVGVGAGLADPYEELQFTTENTLGVEQQVIPSFIALMSPGGDWIRELGFKAREWDGWNGVILKGWCTANRGSRWPARSRSAALSR